MRTKSLAAATTTKYYRLLPELRPSAIYQAFNELINDFIDQILARVSGTNSQFNAMLDDIVASIKDRGETLARVKFAS